MSGTVRAVPARPRVRFGSTAAATLFVALALVAPDGAAARRSAGAQGPNAA